MYYLCIWSSLNNPISWLTNKIIISLHRNYVLNFAVLYAGYAGVRKICRRQIRRGKTRRGKIHRAENWPPGKFAAGIFAARKIRRQENSPLGKFVAGKFAAGKIHRWENLPREKFVVRKFTAGKFAARNFRCGSFR